MLWRGTGAPRRGQERRWSSQELNVSRGARTLFPLLKVKWTLSSSAERKAASLHQFLSSQSGFWLLKKRVTSTSQSTLPSSEVNFEIYGVWDILGGKDHLIFVRWRVGVAPSVSDVLKEALLISWHMFRITLSSLSGVNRDVQLLCSISNSLYTVDFNSLHCCQCIVWVNSSVPMISTVT